MSIPEELKTYLQDYTCEFVNKLLEKLFGNPTTSGIIKQAAGLVGGAIGGVLGFPLGLADAGLSIGQKSSIKLYEKIENANAKHNISNGIKSLVYTSGDKEVNFRTTLIHGGLQIFIAFHQQLFLIPIQNDLNRGRIVNDVVWRVFDYLVTEIKNGNLNEISSEEICKGVILGTSKPRALLKFKEGGSDIQAKNGQTYRTLDFFEKCSFVSNGIEFIHCDHLNKSPKCSNKSTFGHRLLFKWELDNYTKANVNSQLNGNNNKRQLTNWIFWESQLEPLIEHILNETNSLTEKFDSNRDILNQIVSKIENLQISDIHTQNTASEILKTIQEISSTRDNLPLANRQDWIQNAYQNLLSNSSDNESLQDLLLILKGHQDSTVLKLEEINQKLDQQQSIKSIKSELPNEKWLTPQRPKEFQVSSIFPRTQNGIILTEQISSLFLKYSRVAITGCGGYGKTTTALWYANAFSDRYKYLIWLDCESEIKMEKCFESVADKLGIQLEFRLNSPKPLDHFLDEIYQILQPHSCLFIFDNVEFPLNKYLPPLSESTERSSPEPKGTNHHVLITSREIICHDKLGLLQLAVFMPAEAVNFICNGLGITESDKETRKLASELADKLGYLPLALKLVSVKVPNVKDHLRKHLTEIQNSQGYLTKYNLLERQLPEYPKSICSTLEVSLKTLKNNENVIGIEVIETVMTLLYLMCFLDSNKIHKSLFQPVFGENLVYQAFEILNRYSLIEDGPLIDGTQYYTFHRVWQIVLKNQMQNNEEELLNVISIYIQIVRNNEVEGNQILLLLSLWDFISEREVLLSKFHDFAYFIAKKLLNNPDLLLNLPQNNLQTVQSFPYQFSKLAVWKIPELNSETKLTRCKLITLMITTKPYYSDDALRLSEEVIKTMKSLNYGRPYVLRAKYNKAMVLWKRHDLDELNRTESISFGRRRRWWHLRSARLLQKTNKDKETITEALKIITPIYKETIEKATTSVSWPLEVDLRLYFSLTTLTRKIRLKGLYLSPEPLDVMCILLATIVLNLLNGNIKKCLKILKQINSKPNVTPAVICQLQILRSYVINESRILPINVAAEEYEKAFQGIKSNLQIIDLHDVISANSLIHWIKKYWQFVCEVSDESEKNILVTWSQVGDDHFAQVERISADISQLLQKLLPINIKYKSTETRVANLQRNIIQYLLKKKRYTWAYFILNEIQFPDKGQQGIYSIKCNCQLGIDLSTSSNIFLEQYLLESLWMRTNRLEAWRINQGLLKDSLKVANGIVEYLISKNGSVSLVRNAKLNLARVLMEMKRVTECNCILMEIEKSLLNCEQISGLKKLTTNSVSTAELLKYISHGLLRLEENTPHLVLTHVIRFIRQRKNVRSV